MTEPATESTAAPEPSVPEQMRIRRDKRDRLIASGRPAYPVWVDRTHSLAQVREQWAHLETGEETQDRVGVTGRVVFIRNTGKLAFATLQEGIGTRLQVMLSLAEVGEDALAAWKFDVDLDIPRVKGLRREVRRTLAERSRQVLARHRDDTGHAVADCPLCRALAQPAPPRT